MAEDKSKDVSTPNVFANRNVYTINDLSKERGFKEKEYVVGWPHMRFYAEVPIKTTTGILIGSYCVVDNKPRQGLDPESFGKLKEIALVVTKHFELVQAQKNLERSRDMVKALGLFVEGKPSLREWWTDTFNGEVGNLESLQNKTGDRSPLSNDVLTTASDQLENFLKLERFLKTSSESDLTSDEEESAQSASPDEFNSTAATVSDRARESRLSSLVKPGTVMDESELPSSTKVGKESDEHIEQGAARLAQQDLMTYASIKALFSRASQLVREASDLDGIIFVNASLQDVQIKCTKSSAEATNTPQTTTSRSMSETAVSSVGHLSSSNSVLNTVSTPSTAFSISINRSICNKPDTDFKLATCDILGYSLAEESYGENTSPTARQLTIPQSVLQGLLSRFPHGNIFLFDDDGSPFLYEDIDPYPAKGKFRGAQSASKRRSRKFEREKQQMRSYQ